MKWSNVTDSDLNGALAAIKYGYDPTAARNLIEYFHGQFESGDAFNEKILIEFLSHAFRKIVQDGWSADHAFGLKLKRGHYERPDTFERDLIAAAYVILLLRNNWTWLDAKGEAANLLFPDGKGEKAIEIAYSINCVALGHMSNEELKSMLPEGANVISRDMTG